MRPTLALAIGVTLLGACTGDIGGAGLDPGSGGEPGAGGGPVGSRPENPGAPGAEPSPASPPVPLPAAGDPNVAAAGLRRLTNTEYVNTVADLLAGAAASASDLPLESTNKHGLVSYRPLTSVELGGYETMTDKLAVAASQKLDKLLPCVPAQMGEQPCAEKFIDQFGRRAFRRFLSVDETTELRALYKTARAVPGATYAETIALLVRAFLLDPRFLYHRISGETWPRRAGQIVRLTSHETAERLSYLLWLTTPDDILSAEADAGRLRTPEQIAAQVKRLLASPRAKATFGEFVTRWLDLDVVAGLTRDAAKYAEFTAEAQRSMPAETRALFEHVALQGDGRLDTLLTAPFSFVNAPLAKIYGLPAAGADFTRRELDPAVRVGLLTQPSLLAAHASVINRGRFVRERLFCQDLPDPPADIPLPDPKLDARAQAEAHSSQPTCKACHQLIDPIGFGFLAYDGIGRYQPRPGGVPVNSAGNLVSTDVDGEFRSPVELAERAARSAQVAACFARQWLRYASGRMETADDARSVDHLTAAFAGRNMRDLVAALATSDSFLYYRAMPGEEATP